MVRLDLDRIRSAVAAIDPVFLNSPQYECTALGDALGCSMTLKVESLNPVRSFKGRGTEPSWPLCPDSRTGGHRVCERREPGQALAYSGARRGIPVTVVVAQSANPLKVERMRALGATVHLAGDDIEDARLLASSIAEDQRAYLVEDSLDLSTCEGAGTIGLELLGRAKELDTLVIALGGGALASGVGYVAKSLAPHVEVIAVQPKGAPAMALSWRSGRIVETESIDTIADGVAGRCPIPEVLDDLLVVLDDVELVSEVAIKVGMQLLYRHAGLVVEPSAALGVATVLEDPDRFAGRRVATVVCGSNVVSSDFERWVVCPPSP